MSKPMEDWPAAAFGWTESKLQFLTKGSFWKWKSLAFGWMLCMFFSMPRYSDIFQNQVDRAQFSEDKLLLIQQIHDPLNPHIYDAIDQESHFAKRAFRLTVPILCHLFFIDTAIGIYVLQLVIGLAGAFFLISIFYSITNQKTASVLLLLAYFFIFAGKIWYIQFAKLFDGISLAFLFIACWNATPWIMIPSLLLAFFNDERSLVGAVGVVLFYFIKESKPTRTILFIVSGYVLYGVIRWYLGYTYGLHTPLGDAAKVGLGPLVINLWGMQDKFLKCFEGWWILAFAAITVLLLSKKYLYLWLTLSVLALGLGSSLLVFDVDRSLTYSFPLVFSFLWIVYAYDPKISQYVILATAVLCFLIPTHPWIGNVWGSNDANWSIYEILRWTGIIKY